MKNKNAETTKRRKQKVKISDASGSSFKLRKDGFIFFINESLTEMQTANKGTEHYRNQREILFETYFSYMFCAREFNWVTPREIEINRPLIDRYYDEYLQEQLSGNTF